jgi:aldehyde:ferredoxin oxidoreductase
MGLGYALAPVGADHQMNVHDTAYMADGEPLRRVNRALAQPVGPLAKDVLNEDKLQVFVHELKWAHLLDCAVICQFYAYHYEHLAEALSGVTGVEYGIHDVLAVGARAQTLARLFNLREGWTAEDDRLPRRVMQAFDEGPIAGIGITDEAFTWARRRFYELMDWDPESGVPTEQCLKALGLDRLLGA